MGRNNRKKVEHELPFVRLLRLNGRPVDEGVLQLAVADHEILVSVGPPLSSATPPAAVHVNIGTGMGTPIPLTRIGGNAGSGHLWQGTIRGRTLESHTDYLLRVSAPRDASCEVEFRTKRGKNGREKRAKPGA